MGQYYWNRRTEESLRQAIDCFTRALASDPGTRSPTQGWPMPTPCSGHARAGAVHPRDVTPLARAAAARARSRLTRSWRSPPPRWHSSSSATTGTGRKLTGCFGAIELNPHYATARQWYAFLLAIQGRHDDALLEIRRAQELDPLSLPIATGVGRHLPLRRPLSGGD